MGIHDGHRERLKQRFLTEGLDGFKDHEVLELLLYYCIPRTDTNKLGHHLIQEFCTLHTLFEAKPSEVVKRCNVTPHTAILISLIPQLARRYFNSKWAEKPVINNSKTAAEYAMTIFTGRVYECFYVFCLDAQHRLNAAVLINEGTINETSVYTRIVVENVLIHQASCVILVHNHPGGSKKPSKADLDTTINIISALNLLSVDVMDHIIISGNEYYSFAEEKLLNMKFQ